MHHYKLHMKWTGNLGTGTSNYRAYSRNHSIQFPDTRAAGELNEAKPEMLASADPTFRGDPSRYNPEELLLAALSGCHMMSFLHVCVNAGVVVTAYEDNATGTMILSPDGSGRFTEVMLHPVVTVAETSMIEKLEECHRTANRLCFIANSVNFPVRHQGVAHAING